jgi:hypothetical protein
MKYAIIQGRGEFPVDMLRYDSCYPNSERDSSLITSTFDSWTKTPRERWSICVKSASENPWTFGRWSSFGVNIIDVPREMTFEHNSYNDKELAS